MSTVHDPEPFVKNELRGAGNKISWMPSPEDVQGSFLAHLTNGQDAPIAEMAYFTGIRAQLAILAEIHKGIPYEGYDEDELAYQKDMIFLKMLALKKELEA